MIIDVKGCQRCRGNHPDLAAMPLDNHARYKWYQICPTTSQPILVGQYDGATIRFETEGAAYEIRDPDNTLPIGSYTGPEAISLIEPLIQSDDCPPVFRQKGVRKVVIR